MQLLFHTYLYHLKLVRLVLQFFRRHKLQLLRDQVFVWHILQFSYFHILIIVSIIDKQIFVYLLTIVLKNEVPSSKISGISKKSHIVEAISANEDLSPIFIPSRVVV